MKSSIPRVGLSRGDDHKRVIQAIYTMMRTGSLMRTFCLLAAAASLITSTARADVTVFSDQSNPNAFAAFSAAAGPLRSVDFAAGPQSTVETYSPIAGATAYRSFSGLCFDEPYYGGTSVATGDVLRVDLPLNTYAVGMSYASFYLNQGTYTITLSTGDVYQISQAANTTGGGFFGVVSTTPLEWISIFFNTTYVVVTGVSVPASTGSVSACPPGLTMAPLPKPTIQGDDAFGEFTTTANPNGVWSYGYTPALGGPFTRNGTSVLGYNAIPGWDVWLGNAWNCALVGRYPGPPLVGSPTFDGVPLVFEPGLLTMNPACPGAYSVVRWTAQGSGSIRMQGGFQALQEHTHTMDVHIRLNSTISLLDEKLVTYAATIPFDRIVQVNTGDTIDFAVGFLANQWVVLTGFDVTIGKLDSTPPVSMAVASPAPNGSGWNNTDVSVSINSADNSGGAGVKQIQWSLSGAQNSGLQTVAGNTATLAIAAVGTTIVTYYATDNAGNVETARTLTIRIDKTPPAISGVSLPAANAAGWNNGNVAVSFTCSDSISGLAPASPPAPLTLASEGAGQSATGTCQDLAGNSASATVSGINIDKTSPTVSLNGPVNGAVYQLGAAPVASCSATDTLSGVAINPTLSLSGGTANGVGAVTAQCTGASDRAGNTAAPLSITYSVHYGFVGFFPPVSATALNSAKAGQTLPLKWQLTRSDGSLVGALSAVAGISSVSVACATGAVLGPDIPADTSGTSGLRYDSQFVYTWQTDPAWSGSCRRVLLSLDDGTTHTADFILK